MSLWDPAGGRGARQTLPETDEMEISGVPSSSPVVEEAGSFPK